MSTMFRATIMLAVLVGLPAAWIYYGPLPAGAQRVVDQCLAAARDAVDWERLDWGKLAKGELPWKSATKVSAAVELKLMGSAPRFEAEAAPTAAAEAAAPTPPHVQAPIERGATPLHDQLEPLLVQLRSWNVAAYSLTQWGAEGELFRFCCDMPLADGQALTQQFEAIAASPQAAVEHVFREVVAWEAARQSADPHRRLASN